MEIGKCGEYMNKTEEMRIEFLENLLKKYESGIAKDNLVSDLNRQIDVLQKDLSLREAELGAIFKTLSLVFGGNTVMCERPE
jgi:hypothetical protein